MKDLLGTHRRSRLDPFEGSTRSNWTAYVDIYRVALALFVVVGFGLRVWNLGAAPLWVDESFTTWAARQFLAGQGFSDPVGPASPYRRGWLTTTLPISAMFALLGPTEFAARFPSAVLGTLAIVVAYLLGARFHRQVGVLVALLVALDPFALVWAREARMYVHLQLLYLVAVYLLYRWRADDELRLRSVYPAALAGVSLLGLGTHKAFLAFGGVFLLFVSAVLVRHGLLAGRPSGPNLGEGRLAFRAAVLLVGGLAAALGYAALVGVPAVIADPAPATWPTRGLLYYWELFAETYPVLWVLGVAGLGYLVLGDENDQLVALAFLLPFLVASVTARKAPRFVYYLLPLFFVAAAIPTVHYGRLLLGGVASRVGADGSAEYRRTAVSLLLVFGLIVTPPAATLAVPQETADPPFHPSRSSFDEASEFVAAHDDGTGIVMSTRPELSMWYLGETDYFFRQDGLKQVRAENGRLVHSRTGTVVVTNESVLEAAMAAERPIWLLAGKKFEQGFTSPTMRRYVRSNFIAIERPSWDNMVLYYWSPFMHQRSFDEPDALGATTGNAFVASIEGETYLALGRTTDTSVRYGRQGDTLAGQATMRVDVRPDRPAVIRTRTYGVDDGDRFVRVRVSADGEHWRTVARNDDDGWSRHRVVVPAEEIDSDVLYVRFEGGSTGENRYGGLVDYVQVYSLRDWERAVLADARNSSAAGSGAT